MSTFQVINNSRFANTNNKIDEIVLTSSENCQRLCSDTEECTAVSYNPVSRTCIMKSDVGLLTSDNNSMIMIKGPRKSLWWLWVLIIIFFLILFFSKCPGNPSPFLSCGK